MKKKLLPLLLTVATPALSITASATSTIVGTDFEGTTENGMTLEGITYTTTGATVASTFADLTVNNTIGSGNLFTTTAADGVFAVANNTSNGGEWNIQIDFTTGADQIILGAFSFDWLNFNGSGNNQNALRGTEITFDLIQEGSSVISGPLELDTGAINTVNDGVQTNAFDLTGAATLDANTTYTIFLQAGDDPATPDGNNFGFEAITLTGTVVPEPSSALLLGLGSLALISRRKRA